MAVMAVVAIAVLLFAKSHNLTIPQSHNLTISQSHNSTISQSHNPTISQSHNPTISQSHNLTISQSPKAVAFVIGGPNKCSTMTADWMRSQLDEAFAATPGCEHWVTTSRRTPPDVEAVVDSFPFDYKLIYSRDHFNPIPAFVMLADRLYVTAESTGMISEACSFGNAEVCVLDNLKPGHHKFRRFIDSLRRDGYIGTRRKVDLSTQFASAKKLLTANCKL